MGSTKTTEKRVCCCFGTKQNKKKPDHSTLKTHINIHKQIKPFVINVCSHACPFACVCAVMFTYVVGPRDPMLLGVCLNVTLEVDVVALLDVVRIESWAQRKGDLRLVCGFLLFALTILDGFWSGGLKSMGEKRGENISAQKMINRCDLFLDNWKERIRLYIRNECWDRVKEDWRIVHIIVNFTAAKCNKHLSTTQTHTP